MNVDDDRPTGTLSEWSDEELTEVPASAEKVARLEAQVRSLEQQVGQLAAAVHRLQEFGWRSRLKELLGIRLGALHQYRPRPLFIPKHYHRLPPLPESPPSISIVTPSYNHGRYLERTLRSVLDQAYPLLQYIVQDGGSNDDTCTILRRYRDRLGHCASAPDRGQAQAINLGMAHATGDILAYLNSDDLLLPGALHYVACYFAAHPDVDVVYGQRIIIDALDREIGRWVLPPHSDAMLSWMDYVPQETLFWRRRIWNRVGAAMDESFEFALDWELLLRFRDAGARMVRLPRFLGAFRVHELQKTQVQLSTVGEQETHRLRQRCHGRDVTRLEVDRALLTYLLRHSLCERLYRCGLLRY